MSYYGQRGLPRGDYYQGDYYQGDYYMGDPGFFSFLGRVAKGAVGLVKGITGLGGGGSVIKMAPQTALALPTAASKMQKVMTKVGPIVTSALKSKGGKLAMGGAALGAAGLAGAALGRRGMVRAHGTRRRMNVCNPRALRRAIRRTHGFSKLAMRTIHLVHPKKKVRFGGFKKRRRRAA
jgi:hypothetical protein